MNNLRLQEVEKWLKRNLKEKVKINSATVVAFLIAGFVGMTSSTYAGLSITNEYRQNGRGQDPIGPVTTTHINGTDKTRAIIIGDSKTTSREDAVFIGYGINTGSGSTAATQGVAVGRSLTVGSQGVALGGDVDATGRSSIAIGSDDSTYYIRKALDETTLEVTNATGDSYSRTKATGDSAIAIGSRSYAKGNTSIALGALARTKEDYSTAIGPNSFAKVAGAIALGKDSVADRAAGTTGLYLGPNGAGNPPNENKEWKATLGALSVGNDTNTRQITGVAAGSEDTDAVNVAQLKAATFKYYSVNSTVTENKQNDAATGTNAMAIGPKASATGTSGLAVGHDSNAVNNSSVAIGNEVKAQGNNSLAIGTKVSTTNKDSLVIGNNSTTTTDGAIAIGTKSVVKGKDSIVINASSNGTTQSTTNAPNTILIGSGNEILHRNGDGNITGAHNSVLIGKGSKIDYSFSAVAIGDNVAINSARKSVLIGNNSSIGNMQSVGLGTEVNLKGDYAIGIGKGITSSAVQHQNTAIGQDITIGSSATKALAIGRTVTVNAENALAIGNSSQVLGTNGIGIGKETKIETNTSGGIALGTGASVTQNNGIAIGSGASATVEKGVAIGMESVASTAAGQAGYDMLTGAASTDTSATWKSTVAAVSVGDSGKTRQITNVAAGTAETDAVNVAQLKNIKLKYKANGQPTTPKVVEIKDGFNFTSDNTMTVEAKDNGEVNFKVNKGNLTAAANSPITVTGGNGKLVGGNATIDVAKGNLTSNSGDLVITGGDGKLLSGNANIELKQDIKDKLNNLPANVTNELANKAGKDLSNVTNTTVTSKVDKGNLRVSNGLAFVNGNGDNRLVGTGDLTIKLDDAIKTKLDNLPTNVTNDLNNKASKDLSNVTDTVVTNKVTKGNLIVGNGLEFADGKNGNNRLVGTEDLTIKLSDTIKNKLDNLPTNVTTELAGKTDTNLSNITDAGKGVITGLVDVVPKDNDTPITVTSDTEPTSKKKTFKVGIDETKLKELAGTTNLTNQLAAKADKTTVDALKENKISFGADSGTAYERKNSEDKTIKIVSGAADASTSGDNLVTKIEDSGNNVGTITIGLKKDLVVDSVTANREITTPVINVKGKNGKDAQLGVDDEGNLTVINGKDGAAGANGQTPAASKLVTEASIGNMTLTYKANGETDKTTTLANGLIFHAEGDNLSVSTDANGVVKYKLEVANAINTEAGKPSTTPNAPAGTNNPNKLVTEKAVVDHVAGEINKVTTAANELGEKKLTFKATDVATGTTNFDRKNSESKTVEIVKATADITDDEANNYVGENLITKLETTTDGAKISIALKDKPKFKQITLSDTHTVNLTPTAANTLSLTGENNTDTVKLTNLTDGTIDLNSKDAVTGSQLKEIIDASGFTLNDNKVVTPTFTKLKDTKGDDITDVSKVPTSLLAAINANVAKINEGFTFGADNESKIQYLGSKLEVKKGNIGTDYVDTNLNTEYTKDANGNGLIKVGFKKDPTFESVTTPKLNVGPSNPGDKFAEIGVDKDGNLTVINGKDGKDGTGTPAKILTDAPNTTDATNPKLTEGPAGKDGLNGKNLEDKVNALRNGEAGPTVFTTPEGERVVRGEDGKLYKADDLKNNVYDPDTGKYYPKDANGAPDKTQPELADVPKDKVILSNAGPDGDTTTPNGMGNVASGLGLDGKNADGTAGTPADPKAISPEKAKNAIDGLLTKEGPGLNRVATVQDLQALAQAGLDFEGNVTATENADEVKENTTHRALSTKLTIIGKEGVTSFDAYSTDNIATRVSNGKIEIGMLKTPRFDSIELGPKSADATAPDKKIILTPDAENGKLTLSKEPATAGTPADNKVVLDGLKAGETPDSAVTKAQLDDTVIAYKSNDEKVAKTVKLSDGLHFKAESDNGILTVSTTDNGVVTYSLKTADTINDIEGTKLATEGAVKDYVDKEVGKLGDVEFTFKDADGNTYTRKNSETKSLTIQAGDIDDTHKGNNLKVKLDDTGTYTVGLEDELTKINSISGGKDEASKIELKDNKVVIGNGAKSIEISTDGEGAKLTGLTDRTAIKNVDDYGVGENVNRAATEGAVRELSDKLGFTPNTAPEKTPDGRPGANDGLDGKTFKEKIDALRNGEAGPTVFTTPEGDRVVKGEDGKLYKLDDIKNKVYDPTTNKYLDKDSNNGQPVAGSTPAVPLNDNQEVILSNAGPNGDTTTPTGMGNVASGLGLDGKNADGTAGSPKDPKAISPDKAKEVIGGLLEKEGAGLNRVATVQDLQALAQAGLYFEGNDEVGTEIHAPLSKKVLIKGEGTDNNKDFTSAAGNIQVVSDKDSSTLVVKLSESLKNMESFETKNLSDEITSKSKLDKDGLSIETKEGPSTKVNAGSIELKGTDDKDGIRIDANTGTITGLKVSDDPSSAATKGYVDGEIGKMSNAVNELTNSTSKGIAGAMAQAGVKFQEIGINQAVVGAAISNYKGKNGVAVGIQGAPTENVRVHGIISATPGNGKGTNPGVTVGASWKFNLK